MSREALGTLVEAQLAKEAFLSTLKNTGRPDYHRDCETIWRRLELLQILKKPALNELRRAAGVLAGAV